MSYTSEVGNNNMNKKEYKTATLNPDTFLPPEDKTVSENISNPIYF